VISTVHCAFTASVVHLYDLMSSDPTVRTAAHRRIHVCVMALRDMTLWAWSSRALTALHLLAKEWLAQLQLRDISLAELEAVAVLIQTTLWQSSHGTGSASEPSGQQIVAGNAEDDSLIDLDYLGPGHGDQSTGMATGLEHEDWTFTDHDIFDDLLSRPEAVLDRMFDM